MLLRGCVFIFSIGLLLVLQGCVAVQSFPMAARAGDTVTLAVGSLDNATTSNTSAQFVSDVDGTVTNLPIRSVIKLRPDNTSQIATFNPTGTQLLEFDSSHAAWLSVLVLDLPSTGLTIGSGKINITTTAASASLNNLNNSPISIEIIPGEGVFNSFDYFKSNASETGDLSLLEPLPQVVVRPPVADGAIEYSAAEIKVNVPTQNASGNAIPTNSLRVVQDDISIHNTISQTYMTWSRAGDEITVNFVSPNAKMRYFQTRFYIVHRPVPGVQFLSSPGPSVVSVQYYDENGETVTSASTSPPTPQASDFTISIE